MGKAQILVVEGENPLAERLKNRLRDLGYPGPEVVSSGEEAVKKILRTQPDLVLMDFSAGRMEEVRLAEQIRDHFQIPVVYMATDDDACALQRAEGAEPLSYVLGPFE